MVMEQPRTSSRKIVYTIVERRDGKKFWVRIGAAFTNRDGSMSVLLDAMPTNGQLQIREPQPYERRDREPAAEDVDSDVPAELLAG